MVQFSQINQQVVRKTGIGRLIRFFIGFKSWDSKLIEICNELKLSRTSIAWDLGCGWGGTGLDIAKNYGCKVIGVDTSPLGKKDISKYKQYINTFTFRQEDIYSFVSEAISNQENISRQKPDLIIMKDVLEHMTYEEGIEVLRLIRICLNNKESKLIVSVPNASSPFGLRNQVNDITHRSSFGHRSLNNVLSEAGFNNIVISTLDEASSGKLGLLLDVSLKVLVIPLSTLFLKPLIGWNEPYFWSNNLYAYASI